MSEKAEIKRWVDNRFGSPNTFNPQLLTDFLKFAIDKLDYIKLPTPDSKEWEELRLGITDIIRDYHVEQVNTPELVIPVFKSFGKILSLLAKGGK